MANMDQILQAARQLGKLLADHEATQNYNAVLKALKDDADAGRMINDYGRHRQSLAEKEVKGQPIEVADKRRLEQLQDQVSQHPLLRRLQLVEMDYLDLMRQVDETISGENDLEQAAIGSAAASLPKSIGS